MTRLLEHQIAIHWLRARGWLVGDLDRDERIVARLPGATEGLLLGADAALGDAAREIVAEIEASTIHPQPPPGGADRDPRLPSTYRSWTHKET